MLVIPAIDIRNGRCTRLVEGDYEREVQFDARPADAARRWADAGAKLIHVVDLDGARDGVRPNSEAVKSVIAEVNIPVQVGGGIRKLVDADDVLASGANRVIFGTTLVENPATVAEAVDRFGARHVAVSIDARDGEVRTRGWRTGSGIDAIDLATRAVDDCEVETIIYTDTARDGTLAGPNIEAVANLVQAVDCDVIAAGGVSSIDDLMSLKQTGIAGAITGMAIYTGQLDLAQAIDALAD